MLKAEVEIGGIYRVRWHDGSFTNVQVLGERRAPRAARRAATAASTTRRTSPPAGSS